MRPANGLRVDTAPAGLRRPALPYTALGRVLLKARSLALPALTVAGLRAHRVRQLQARLVAGADWQDQGFVFTTPVGTPLDQSNVSKQFKHLLDTAGLRSMRIHDLRHSCATLLLAQGVDARTIMERLGHSQVSLTLNTYSHVLPTLQRAAAAQMDKVLG